MHRLPEILQDASGLDLMLMLDKLHRMGYEKLRWFSYMAPNGYTLRCHVTIATNIHCDRDIVDFGDEIVLGVSVGSFDATADIDELVKAFLESFPQLAKAGQGKDSRYRAWYKELLRLAKKGRAPEFNGEYYTVPLGKIRILNDFFPAPPGTLRMISWNIDGLKAKWQTLGQLIEKYSPEVICLQKVKRSGEVMNIDGYRCFLSSAPYAGVCTYIRKNISANFDEEIQSNPDAVGYLQRFSIIHPCLSLFNCYVPYSNPDVPGAIEHRKHFNRLLFNVVTSYPDRLVLCGDMNIVHGKEDCWDSKYQRNQANFTDWERKDFDKLLELGGLVDTYRHFNYFNRGFTYFFRNDPEVRKKNQGHRIDYFLASQSLVPQIVRADIINDITASTNNPILLDIEY